MPRSLLTVAFSITALFILSACNGPTKTGQEARKAANERLSLVNAQVSYQQAEQAYKAGQLERAAKEIRTAIMRYSEAANYYVLQGRIFIEQQHLEEAMQCFNTALEKDETCADAHYYSGIVYQRWSDDEQAYQSYRKAFELQETKVQYLLATAESLIALGEVQAARDLVEPRLNKFEYNPAMHQLLGQIAMLQGDAPRAVQLYTQARLLNPDDSLLLEQLMFAQFRAGQFGQCLESVLSLQSRTRDNRSDLMLMQARCLARLDRKTEARNIYLQITRQDASDLQVWMELGVLAWDINDWSRLGTSGTRLMALAPDRYEGYMFKGLGEQNAGRNDEARKLFEQAAQRAPDAALPHLLLGKSMQTAGDLTAARNSYARALQIDPTNADAKALYQQAGGRQMTSVPDSAE